MGIDILGVDILGIDILGIDILAPTRFTFILKHSVNICDAIIMDRQQKTTNNHIVPSKELTGRQ